MVDTHTRGGVYALYLTVIAVYTAYAAALAVYGYHRHISGGGAGAVQCQLSVVQTFIRAVELHYYLASLGRQH